MIAPAWIDGQPVPAGALRALALHNYGHFTTVQVRDGAVRGLDLHLARLCAGNRELFGHRSDPAALRAQMRQALRAAGTGDATLRATAFAPDFDPLAPTPGGAEPLLMVSISPPRSPAQASLRLRSVGYLRAAPHIKHVGMFPMHYFRQQARRAGFDDALLIAPDGRVLEGSTWNLGFWRDGQVTWPQGPMLEGTGRALLQAGLEALGVGQQVRAVPLRQVADFQAAFACNSAGVRLVASIDGQRFPGAPALAELLEDALAVRSWETI